jgi:3-oxoacyl-[acyl-carrier-protein] synthase II
MFLIEDLEHARARKANILAEVTALGYAFDPFRINKYNRRGPGIRAAYRATLEDGGFSPKDIGYISANANATIEADQIEAEAIQEVFGDAAGRIPVSSIKSMTGESFSVCGGFQLASAVGVVTRGVIPPTINLDQPDPKCALDHVAGRARKKDVQNVLVSCFGPSGSNSCVVISKFNESAK